MLADYEEFISGLALLEYMHIDNKTVCKQAYKIIVIIQLACISAVVYISYII